MANVPIVGREDLDDLRMFGVSFDGEVLFVPALPGTGDAAVDAAAEARKLDQALDFARLVAAFDDCHLKQDRLGGLDLIGLQGLG